MKPIGTAVLIPVAHSSGVASKAWDLKPFGGPEVFMGSEKMPLPATDTFVDRGPLRLNAKNGDVFRLEAGDPPPTVGPSGKLGAFNLRTALIVGGVAYLLAGGAFLRRTRRR
jgi:hypothetical protein